MVARRANSNFVQGRSLRVVSRSHGRHGTWASVAHHPSAEEGEMTRWANWLTFFLIFAPVCFVAGALVMRAHDARCGIY